MKWYSDMTGQQKQSFSKVIAVCLTGVVLILLIPTVLHFIL